jgi:hypothetical protein
MNDDRRQPAVPTLEQPRDRAQLLTENGRPLREDEGLVMFLERDQLVLDKSKPAPRAQLSKRTSAALWALRVFSLAVGAMVIYTFFSQLAG